MNTKIRNKFIEIKNNISDWFIIQIIRGSAFWKFAGIDCVTDSSCDMLGK